MTKHPQLGDSLSAFYRSGETLDLLRRRRSTPADFLGAPGPKAGELDVMLAIAARAPDHRRVTPFRFMVFEGEGRDRFGALLEKRFLENEPDAGEERVAFERGRFLRAPVVVAVVSSINPAHRTPEWEQILTAGAVCQNLLIAASAHGFAVQWITEWYAYDTVVGGALGLGENERIAGFIYIGTASENPKERARPDMASIVSHF